MARLGGRPFSGDDRVGIVSFVAVAAAIAAVVALTVGLSLAGMRAFHATDNLESFAPWRTTAPDGVVATNPLAGDTVDVVLPERAVFAHGLDSGEIRLRQPYILGGRPLASVPNKGIFSPLNIPYWLTALWYAPGLAKLLELIVAVVFTALFLRSVGIQRSAAYLGGLIFAFSGFQVAWTNWPQTHVTAMIPVLFWAIEFIRRRGRWYTVVPLAAATGIMWLEGFPSVTSYALLFAGAYTLVRGLSETTWRKRVSVLAISLSGVVLGTAVAAFQLAPFASLLGSLDLSTRIQTPATTLAFRVLSTFVVPNAFGSPVDRNYYGPMNYIEIQAFIGIAAMVLVAAAVAYGWKLVPRGVYWYFIGATGIAFLLMFVGGPLLGLLQNTSLFGMNFIGRMRSTLGFLLAILAAIGFDALLRSVPGSVQVRTRLVFIGTLIVMAAVFTGALYRAWQMASAAEQLPYLRSHLILGIALFGVVLVAVAMAHSNWRAGLVIAAVVIPFVVAIETVNVAGPFWPQVPVDEFYPVTESHDFLRTNLGSDRIAAAGLAMYPGTTSYFGIRSVTGHAFHDPSWRDLLLVVDPDVMHASPTFSIFASTASIADSPILDRLSARYFVADPRIRLAGGFSPRTPSGSTRLLPGDTIEVSIDPDTLGVVLHLPVAFDPGKAADLITVERVATDGSVTAQGFRRLTMPLPEGYLEVGLPEAEADHAGTIRIRFEGDTSIEVGADAKGEPLVDQVEATTGDVRLVFAGGTVIYERLSALPRIRWAGTAVVVEDPEARLQIMTSGLPPESVVVNSAVEPGSGLSAYLEVLTDRSDLIEVRVEAEGSGFLVVADTIQSEWTATVDGEPAEILAADHAVGTIRIQAGNHVVSLRYAPTGRIGGLLVTFGALAILFSVAGVAIFQNRRRRNLVEV